MFRKRSDQKELLDQDFIPVSDLYRNLYELHVINKYLGGYRISTNALSNIMSEGKSFTIVDIGSGGGDTLRQMYLWAKKNMFTVSCFGIDLKEDCINYSNKHHNDMPLVYIQDDYRNVSRHLDNVDIIHASLFCHHLSNDQIVELIDFCIEKGTHLVVNDLHRNPLAYYSIKWLTSLFSKSYLVKNDAPLSVLRGFSKVEWMELLSKSRAKKYSVRWKWAFRYQIIVFPHEK
jgi:2-polyprenyl-3-methyl-5-hydroxy-6-metoxy-1,4-benzoquinol methylase